MRTAGLVIGGFLVVLLLMAAAVYSYCNGLYRQGIDMETRLNAQYLDNQNELSTYIASFYEQIGVANLKSDKMDQILTDAIKGRYDKNGSVEPGRGQMFSAIVEAYPNLDLSVYDKIIDFIRAGREAYKQKQSKLLDMLRAYDKWRKDGYFQQWALRSLGFPSEALEARIGTNVKRGQAALDQMYLIVLTGAALDAYESGRMDPLPVPGSTPAKSGK